MRFLAGKTDQRGFLQMLLLGIFKVTFGFFTKLQYKVKMKKNDACRLEGPYFLLANHSHNMDPVFVQYFWPRLICFVTNDTAWKVKTLAKLLDALGFIPIRKMMTDSQSVRSILKNIEKGRIIGIFPEGKRSWDGKTGEIIPTTASLIKKLKLPVVTVLIQGGMMSWPRWSNRPRRGEIVLMPKVTLTTEQIEQMSAEEILTVITHELDHNEHEYLAAHPKLKFKSKAPAECLELFSFACPECKALAKMRSEGDRLFCTACGATYVFCRDATLYKESDNRRYTLPELSEFQDAHVLSIIKNAKAKNDFEHILFSDNEVALFEYVRLKPLIMITKGTLTMNTDRIVFHGEDRAKRTYLANELTGINIQKNNQLEFTFGNRTFRFLFKERVSAYKWQRALFGAQEI